MTTFINIEGKDDEMEEREVGGTCELNNKHRPIRGCLGEGREHVMQTANLSKANRKGNQE